MVLRRMMMMMQDLATVGQSSQNLRKHPFKTLNHSLLSEIANPSVNLINMKHKRNNSNRERVINLNSGVDYYQDYSVVLAQSESAPMDATCIICTDGL
ncbi:hypothetical protein HanPSC8_Chr02g0053561 [Helianthus annuus]|nr:hypothetical protein HanPSC8_Chr02g0053561 [Helianthus annuus]